MLYRIPEFKGQRTRLQFKNRNYFAIRIYKIFAWINSFHTIESNPHQIVGPHPRQHCTSVGTIMQLTIQFYKTKVVFICVALSFVDWKCVLPKDKKNKFSIARVYFNNFIVRSFIQLHKMRRVRTRAIKWNIRLYGIIGMRQIYYSHTI